MAKRSAAKTLPRDGFLVEIAIQSRTLKAPSPFAAISERCLTNVSGCPALPRYLTFVWRHVLLVVNALHWR